MKFIIFLLIAYRIVYSGPTCNKISLSTNISSTKSDVVYNGEVKNQWVEKSDDPILT